MINTSMYKCMRTRVQATSVMHSVSFHSLDPHCLIVNRAEYIGAKRSQVAGAGRTSNPITTPQWPQQSHDGGLTLCPRLILLAESYQGRQGQPTAKDRGGPVETVHRQDCSRSQSYRTMERYPASPPTSICIQQWSWSPHKSHKHPRRMLGQVCNP